MPTLGLAKERGSNDEYRLKFSSKERAQGTYVIGTPGTGKTTLLRNMIIEDMWLNREEGLCVLDPHGDLIDELLTWVPTERLEDVIYFNPLDMARPLGLNMLACDREDETELRWVQSGIVETLRRLFWYSWGPRLEHVLQHTIKTALLIDGSTFLELLLLLTSRPFRDEFLGPDADKPDYENGIFEPERDSLLVTFWYDWFFKLNQATRTEIISSCVNKLSPFLLDTTIRNIIGQSENSFNMYEAMNEGKIILVNLSKGDLGENVSSLLGSVVVNQVLLAALRRRQIPTRERKPFHLYVDEYQNFANPSFSLLQSEARKFAVDVTVAHQFRDQLDLESKGASLNVANLIVFRVSGRDSYDLASQFNNTPPPGEVGFEPLADRYMTDKAGRPLYYQPETATGVGKVYQPKLERPRPYSDVEAQTANELSTLPDFVAYCRLIRRVGEQRPQLKEFQLHTYKDPQVKGQPDERVAEAVIERSRQMYGKPRADVERAIHARSHGHAGTPEVAAFGLVVDTSAPGEEVAERQEDGDDG